MKVALYARISTSEERQNLETQLLPLRDYCQAVQYEVYQEYTDVASARDIAHRLSWRRLLDDAAKKKFKAVVVFKLDRAFRSVKDMHDCLTAWEISEVQFISYREQFNTTTAAGRLLMHLLASLAESELELIKERILAGMDRAKKQGTRSGKPIGRKGLDMPVSSIIWALQGSKTITEAAAKLKCSRRYIYKRLAEMGTSPLAVMRGEHKK